ncbi:MAG: hypothetical protein ACRETC_03060 [Gammaproteobacteria bacterium]
MRFTSTLLVASALALASAGALANAPATTLASGAIVDLNTGIVTTPAGTHYKLSAAKLKALRERVEGGAATTMAPSAATGTTADHKQQGRPPQ